MYKVQKNEKNAPLYLAYLSVLAYRRK